MYRPRQPNWEYVMWKSSNFPATLILCETIWAALNFDFLENFDILKHDNFPKIKFKASKIVQTAVFGLIKSAKIDIT